ncbi:MAG: 50S ribosomal protein L1 [Cytophagales bacterium]|nr:50S ribosomal protein L1 [Cytophagales bacterium]
MSLSKAQKEIVEKLDLNKSYTLSEACTLVKDSSHVAFDASVDLSVRLGIDPKKGDQSVRGVVLLPHGTGKKKRVLVLCSSDKEKEAKEAGADHVGLENYLSKIEGGWLEVEAVVATPDVMAKLGKLGKILGPRNLMPNPKLGTVTSDVGEAVKKIKLGKIEIKNDKYGIVHASVGRVSFPIKKLEENIEEFMKTLIRLKPSSAKGLYLKTISLSSTMGPGISLNKTNWIT